MRAGVGASVVVAAQGLAFRLVVAVDLKRLVLGDQAVQLVGLLVHGDADAAPAQGLGGVAAQDGAGHPAPGDPGQLARFDLVEVAVDPVLKLKPLVPRVQPVGGRREGLVDPPPAVARRPGAQRAEPDAVGAAAVGGGGARQVGLAHLVPDLVGG